MRNEAGEIQKNPGKPPVKRARAGRRRKEMVDFRGFKEERKKVDASI